MIILLIHQILSLEMVTKLFVHFLKLDFYRVFYLQGIFFALHAVALQVVYSL
jgi:hypothetical protein